MDTVVASVGDPLVSTRYFDSPSPIHADPLIEVQSVTIHPYQHSLPQRIWGQVFVLDEKTKRINELYKRVKSKGDTLLESERIKGYSLPLTGPTSGAISMVGTPTIVIKLIGWRKHPSFVPAIKKGKSSPFADVRANLDTSTTHLCYGEPKSLCLEGSLGYVRVNYIVLPCACIAHVEVTLTKEEEDEGRKPVDIVSPVVHVSGSIIACYGKTSGNFAGDSQPPSFILHKDECGTVAYEVPIKHCRRSFVCIPAYSSLLLTLNLTFTFKDFDGGKHVFSVNESAEFKTVDGVHQTKYFCVGESSLEVALKLFTSDHPCFLEIYNLHPESLPSAFRNEPPELRVWGRDRIEVLSVFVGCDDGKMMNDVYGVIDVKFSKGSYYIFKRDEKNPDKLSRHGKALSLEGLTTECSDWFYLRLRLKDMSCLVDIYNDLHICYYHYDLKRQWFNRPLCSVVFGKQGFAVVHYIIFENAVKATLKISVVAKVSDSLPVVYGALVAQYSNYDYETSFQKNYWRSVLFQEKDACHLSEDGQVPLSKSVVSVPMGSSLVIDVDLHASLDVCYEDHFKDSVELEFRDFGCKKLTGEYYDVLFYTVWTDGDEC